MSQDLRKLCPHCGERLAPRTLREHKRLFFNANSRTWVKKRRVDVDPATVDRDSDSDTDDAIGDPTTDLQIPHGVTGCQTDYPDTAASDISTVNTSTEPIEDQIDGNEGCETDIESEYESESEPECYDNQIEESPNKFSIIIRWLLMLILFWHIAHNISAGAINELLHFLSCVFSVTGNLVSPSIAMSLSAFPASLFLAYKYLKIESDSFVKYVLCPKCHALYDYGEAITGGSLKRCSHIRFPLHPQRNRRIPCGTPLLKRIHHSNGSMEFYALHCYVSKSIKDSLQRIFVRKGIHLKIDSWRKRRIPEGHYSDVYDGRVWKSFIPTLFHQKRSLGLMINVDWFEPFKHCTDSLGAIYLVIMNLPRKERYKRENIILAGLLPPLEAEPPSLNTFLAPIVTELKSLWTGIRFYTSDSQKYKILIRGALICAACDVPAARKLCGFKGHNGHRGCSKCFKQFPGPVTKKDYSGFDRSNWPQRDLIKHQEISKKIFEATTAYERNELEVKYGIYYSIVSDLDYFNPIQHTVVDPMHNLFLGTAKRIFKKIWIPRGLLKESVLKEVQARIDSINVPSTIGRIPKKIASAFGGFTAEQWMNWTTVYSLYALRGLIPEEHYRCWESFVIACRLLCQPVLCDIDIKKADLLLLHFCKKVEELYGKSEITPNMHLHCHLADCVFDYGPIFGFWLFSFERYNGMLGRFPNNQKHIEVQIMRHFETEMQVYALSLPETFHEHFAHLFKSSVHVCGSDYDSNETSADLSLHNLSIGNLQEADPMTLFNCTWKFPKNYKLHLLPDAELVPLSQVLRTTISLPQFIPDIGMLPRQIRRYKRIEFGTEVLSVFNDSRYGRHSYIMASWVGEDSDIDTTCGMRPARIKDIFSYTFTASDGVARSLVFAKVEWYKVHTKKRMFGAALELYNRNEFEPFGLSSYIPIACIRSKFAPAYGTITITGSTDSSSTTTSYESVLFICPLRSKVFIQ